MNPDDFENQLRRQPVRPVPAEWRGEILARAKSALAESEELEVSRLLTETGDRGRGRGRQRGRVRVEAAAGWFAALEHFLFR